MTDTWLVVAVNNYHLSFFDRNMSGVGTHMADRRGEVGELKEPLRQAALASDVEMLGDLLRRV